jgi:hypothetical protein
MNAKKELGSLASIIGGDEEKIEKDIQAVFDFAASRVEKRKGDIFDFQIVIMGVLEELNSQIREEAMGEEDDADEDGI